MRNPAWLLLIMLSLPVAADPTVWTSRSGYYRISFESEIDPLTINRIHYWTFKVTTPAGEPVRGAVISVTGGMPLHNHGLPTAPRQTAELDGGRYRVEGFRFHMRGDWELVVTIDVPDQRDTAVISLTL